MEREEGCRQGWRNLVYPLAMRRRKRIGRMRRRNSLHQLAGQPLNEPQLEQF